MPADVAVTSSRGEAFLQEPGIAVSKFCRSPETKSGSMILVGPGKHSQSVQVKVYRTSLEHFAVVYPQKKICRPLGFLNLRNTMVERLPSCDDYNDVPVKTPLGCSNTKVRQTPVWIPRDYQHNAGFVVRQRGCDSPSCLTFLSESPKDLESWLSAFDSKATPTIQTSPLPILEEGEEV